MAAKAYRYARYVARSRYATHAAICVYVFDYITLRYCYDA